MWIHNITIFTMSRPTNHNLRWNEVVWPHDDEIIIMWLQTACNRGRVWKFTVLKPAFYEISMTSKIDRVKNGKFQWGHSILSDINCYRRRYEVILWYRYTRSSSLIRAMAILFKCKSHLRNSIHDKLLKLSKLEISKGKILFSTHLVN